MPAKLNVFSAIYNSDRQALEKHVISMVNPEQCQYPKPLALLALDHLFEDITTVTLNTQDDVARGMFLFLQYTRLMQEIICHPEPSQSDLCQKVFAVRPQSDHSAVLPRGTYLYQRYMAETEATDDTVGADACVESAVFNQGFQFYLRERLWHRVQSQLDIFSGIERYRMAADSVLQLLEPCPNVGMSRDGRCVLPGCTLAHTLDATWFNRRLRVYLHQIMVLDVAHKQCEAYEFPVRIKERR